MQSSPATSFTKGQTGAVTVKGNATFMPAFEHEVVYGDLPGVEVEEELSLYGPMSAEEFLDTINMSTNWTILVTEAVKPIMLNFWIYEKTAKEAFEILKFHGIYYEFKKETGFLYVMTVEEHLLEKYGDNEYVEFTVQHADVAYIESMISSLASGMGRIITDSRTNHIYVWDMADNLEFITKAVEELDVPFEKREFYVEYADMASVEGAFASLMSPSGSVMSDPRTGQIFVWDLPRLLDQMEEALVEIDVPMEKAEFLVQHSDIADIEGVISSLMSQNGSVLADPRTGQVFVWDLPANIDKIASAIERLDIPVESRTFEILHVNAEDLVDSIEAVLSERGSVVVDPRYNSLVVTDLPKRVDRMAETIAALDRKLETRTWTINYADIDFLADQIELYIPAEMGEVAINDAVHQITVSGLPSRLDELEKLIQTWDVKRKQVLIEAFVVEVSDDVQRELGIDWSYFTQHGSSPVRFDGGSGFTRDSGDLSVGQMPFEVPAYGDLAVGSDGNISRPLLQNISGDTVFKAYGGNNLGVTLSYLDQENKATVLSSPRVVVQDSEEAIFENATKVPYVSSSGYGSNYGGNYGSNYGSNYNNNNYNNNSNRYYRPSSNRVEFIDVGTILSVLPRVTEEDNILLDISAEDSTFTDKEIVANDQRSTVPEKTVRRAETQLRVASGETVVLGGLRKDRSNHSVNKTPLLGDIPLLGRLFRSPTRASKNSELLIFITTTIVDEYTHPEAQQLRGAIDTLAEDSRHDQKNLWGRLEDRVTKGRNELGVSIGQHGHIHSEGQLVTLDGLRRAFFAVNSPPSVLVVIRQHPRAPIDLVTQVTEAALEADLKVEFDDSLAPIVSVRPNPEDIPPPTPLEGTTLFEPTEPREFEPTPAIIDPATLSKPSMRRLPKVRRERRSEAPVVVIDPPEETAPKQSPLSAYAPVAPKKPITAAPSTRAAKPAPKPSPAAPPIPPPAARPAPAKPEAAPKLPSTKAPAPPKPQPTPRPTPKPKPEVAKPKPPTAPQPKPAVAKPKPTPSPTPKPAAQPKPTPPPTPKPKPAVTKPKPTPKPKPAAKPAQPTPEQAKPKPAPKPAPKPKAPPTPPKPKEPKVEEAQPVEDTPAETPSRGGRALRPLRKLPD